MEDDIICLILFIHFLLQCHLKTRFNPHDVDFDGARGPLSILYVLQTMLCLMLLYWWILPNDVCSFWIVVAFGALVIGELSRVCYYGAWNIGTTVSTCSITSLVLQAAILSCINVLDAKIEVFLALNASFCPSGFAVSVLVEPLRLLVVLLRFELSWSSFYQ